VLPEDKGSGTRITRGRRRTCSPFGMGTRRPGTPSLLPSTGGSADGAAGDAAIGKSSDCRWTSLNGSPLSSAHRTGCCGQHGGLHTFTVLASRHFGEALRAVDSGTR
jgi:hypothetical protein